MKLQAPGGRLPLGPGELARSAVGLLAAAAVVVVALRNHHSLHVSGIALGEADREWLLTAIAGTALLVLAGTLCQLGSLPTRPPLGPLVAVQVAGAFANHVVPAGLGGMAVNWRFLRRLGFGRAVVMRSAGLNAAATAGAHVMLMLILLPLVSRKSPGTLQAVFAPVFSFVPEPVLLTIGGVLVAAVVAAVARPGIRKRLRAEAVAVRRLLAHPVRAAQLLVGSTGSTLLHGAVLYAVVRSLDGTVPLALVATAYVVASALSALIPAPGAVGPLDLLLVGLLIALGLEHDQALAAVLGYRMVTAWLPLVPGALVLTVLVRRKVI